jgi:hypothetical protein
MWTRHGRLLNVAAAVACIATSSVVMVAPSAAVEPVLTTSSFEFAPAGDAFSVTHVSNSEDRPRHFDAFWSGIPINPRHSRGGSASVYGDTVAFEYKDGGHWDIRLWDSFFFEYIGTPEFLNTRRAERAPSLWGDRLLLTRIGRSRSKVLLLDLVTGDSRTLATAPRFGAWSQQVSGNFAVYAEGRNVFVYDIAAGASVRFPERGSGSYESASVTSDGTAYAAHLTGERCSGEGEIRRMDPDGTVTTIHAFPPGQYVTSRTTAIETAQGTTILFDRFDCRTGDSDIYRLDGADTADGMGR